MSRVPSRGGEKSRGQSVLVLLVVVVALAGVAVPAASFSTADVPRDASVSVASDSNGLIKIEKFSPVTKQRGRTANTDNQKLVAMTNRAGEALTTTVTLTGISGELTVDTDGDGTVEKTGRESVSFQLPENGAQRVVVYLNTKKTGDFQYAIGSEGDSLSFSTTKDGTVDQPTGPPGGSRGTPGSGGDNGNGNGNGNGSGDGPGNSCPNDNNPNCP